MEHHQLEYVQGQGPDLEQLELASLICAATNADEAELAQWPAHLLHRTESRLAGLEATAAAIDAGPRDQAADGLWTINHRMMTTARYLRAKIRPHLTRSRPDRS